MQLFYRQYGSGRPFIILHGLYGLSDNWVSIAKRISEKFSVWLPDLRNHGHSPHSPVHDYPAMAEDLNEFIEEHGLRSPVILGHSMGGKAAMCFALEYPGCTDRLVVVDIAPRVYGMKNIHLDILQAMMAVDLDHVSSRMEVEEQIRYGIHDTRIQLFIMKNLYRTSHNRFGWRVNLKAISNNLDLIAGDAGLHGVYDKPALFLRGERSDYIEEADFPLIRSMFPVSWIHTIKRAGHWVHADAPAEMCSALRDFTGEPCEFREME